MSETSKRGFIYYFAWFWGIMFVSLSTHTFLRGDYIAGALLAVVAIYLIPPIYQLVCVEKLSIKLNKLVKVILTFVLLSVASYFSTSLTGGYSFVLPNEGAVTSEELQAPSNIGGNSN